MIRVFLGKQKQVSLNIIDINQGVSDPYSMISGDVNGDVIRWIRRNSHRVLAKKTGEGVVTYCRLNDSNSNNYYDGTDSNITGLEGDVFMKMPEFYYKGVNYNTDVNVQMFFAREKLDDDYIRWNPNTLIGVYEAYIEESRMYSRSGVASTGNVGQGTCKTAAANRGDGYQLVDWQMHCIMGCLYYAMYGNTDCQNSVGKGTDAYNKPTGQTNNLGMNDTVAGGNGDNQSINYWGLENWWGNKFEWIHDYINEANTNTAYVNDPAGNGTRGWYINRFNGYYPKKMRFGRYLDLYASPHDPANNNSATTGYCDYQYWAQSSTLSNSVLKRSGNNSRTLCGVAYAGTTKSTSSEDIGSRLAFRGVCIEELNVDTFKAMS